jgi:hypothetical protein
MFSQCRSTDVQEWRVLQCSVLLRSASASIDKIVLVKFDTIENVVPNPTRHRTDRSRDFAITFPQIGDLHDKARSDRRGRRCDCAVVEDESLVGRIDCAMEQFHRPIPPSNDSILRNIVPSLRHTQGNALDVCPGIIRPNEERLRKKSGSPGTYQKIHFAWMRHHRFEAEASPCFDAGVAPTVCDRLRLADAIFIETREPFCNLIWIDVLAELDALSTEPSSQCGLAGAIGPGDHQYEGFPQDENSEWKSSNRMPRFFRRLRFSNLIGRRSNRPQVLHATIWMITKAPTVARACHWQAFRTRFLGGGAPSFAGKSVQFFGR